MKNQQTLRENSLFADDEPEYTAFCNKFKPKHTTDDCYTPENVYKVILDYVCRRWNIDPARVIRPFWPGADYQLLDYPPECVVVDNPPFSIFNKICNFYANRGIKFFLFGPGLTLFSSDNRYSYLETGNSITYANGANVLTGFVHNFEPEIYAESSPELHDLIEAENKKNLKQQKKQVAKLAMPNEILTAAKLRYFAVHGTHFVLKKTDAVFVRKLDNLPGGIYGGGLLLKEKAAAEKAAAEKAAAEKAAYHRAAAEKAAAEKAAAEKAAAKKVQFSPRELAIIEMLNRKGEKENAAL